MRIAYPASRSTAQAKFWFLLFGIVLMLAIVTFGCGCNGQLSPPTANETAKLVNDAAGVHSKAQATVADLQAKLAETPADMPARKQIEDLLASAKKTLAKSEEAVAVAKSAADAIASNDTSELEKLLGKFGGWASLAGFGLFAVQTVRRRRIFEAAREIVTSVEQAIGPRTDEQKAILKDNQSPYTQSIVDRLKS